MSDADNFSMVIHFMDSLQNEKVTERVKAKLIWYTSMLGFNADFKVIPTPAQKNLNDCGMYMLRVCEDFVTCVLEAKPLNSFSHCNYQADRQLIKDILLGKASQGVKVPKQVHCHGTYQNVYLLL